MRRAAARAGGIVVVVVAATATAWLLVHVLRPGLFAGEEGTLPERLARFLDRAFLHFDFGDSQTGSRRPVSTLIREGFGADVSVLAGGIVVGFGVGVGGALLCARRPRGLLSRVVQVLAMVALCAPVYVVGLFGLLLLGDEIGVLPFGAGVPLRYSEPADGVAAWLASMIAPWIVLGLPLAGMCLRTMLGEVVEVADQDFVRAARAKGLSEGVVLRRHIAPVALSPTAMLVSSATPLMLTNLVLVEQVFSVPGLFGDFRDAVGTGNYPLIYGMTAVGALLIAAMTLCFDALHAWLDPRVRAGAA